MPYIKYRIQKDVQLWAGLIQFKLSDFLEAGNFHGSWLGTYGTMAIVSVVHWG